MFYTILLKEKLQGRTLRVLFFTLVVDSTSWGLDQHQNELQSNIYVSMFCLMKPTYQILGGRREMN